ncbi:hypothetical protein GCM10011581_49290 [Saccharopolyspora subtropica]|uniref:Uncharacterized protein n=1 Tax=Saccharopolyspora thermophila TaxID=89367 RepID=A0A917KB24_9PSEU|nr:hypothetical protein [Saccharopolyspora subtropica]GGJ06497.1 hypothetical protein GCM10011581_49290 [Saccharopolyspora subtropica]
MPAAKARPPRVLRWILLLLVTWLVTSVYFVTSTEVTIWYRTFGGGQVAVEPTARVELEAGQPFGLATFQDEIVTCDVIPEAGEPRSFRASDESDWGGFRSNPRLPAERRAWFTGPAEIRCSHAAVFLPPERYDRTGMNVLMGLMAASSALIVVVLVQIARRVRFNNRRYART